MKIVVDRAVLVQSLQLLSRVNSNQPGGAVVSIEVTETETTLSATDIEFGLTIRLTPRVMVAGQCVVPLKLFLEFITLTQDPELTLEVKDIGLHITGKKASANIRLAQAIERLSEPLGETLIECDIPAALFDQALQAAIPAASLESSRPILGGVALINTDGLRVVATDSFRLSEVSVVGPWIGPQTVIPLRAAIELSRLCRLTKTIHCFFAEGRFCVTAGQATLTSRTLDGAFPDYQRIIPQTVPAVIEVNREELIRAIKLASLFTKAENQAIRIQVGEGKVVISGLSELYGEQTTELTATYQGEQVGVFSLGLNARYVLDGLLPITTPVVQIGVTNGESPVVIRNELSDQVSYLYLVMPLHTPQPVAAQVSSESSTKE